MQPAIQTMHFATPGPRRTVIELFAAPGLSDIGDADHSYECPECHALLLERVDPRTVAGLTFRCPECGTCASIEAPKVIRQ